MPMILFCQRPPINSTTGTKVPTTVSKPGMDRRDFLHALTATVITPTQTNALVAAARAQIGVTTTYDPTYRKIAYPNGDVPRSTGICADVIIRACRDALALDLQQLLHEDMLHNFSAYPRTWGTHHPDTNIDHRRVLNLQTYWSRKGAKQWSPRNASAPGDTFGPSTQPGDFVTWLISGRLPHVGILATSTTVVHNIGNGAEETPLAAFRTHPAVARYRWPS